ncbi:hypothetical protein KEM48_006975 [Puccinia striiformis f. sp. tritici PST-130]|nr:hypothetical protein KEM48_006975 [Puccinia striiformis f. sp. tritici PST-130]
MSFPNFPNEEIAEAIQNFGFPTELTTSEIAKPTSSKMMLIHEWFLLYFTSITRDEIRNAVMEPLLNILHPEIYQYRVMAGTFRDVLDQIMRCASINDFSDRDLFAPTAERARRVLSGLINFALFESEQSEQTLRPLEKTLEDLQGQREQLLDREAELMEEIARMQQKQEEEERAVAELNPELDRLKASILESKGFEGPLDQRRLELVESHKVLTARHSATTTECERLEADIVRLSSRLDLSPEKVKNSIEALQSSLASEMATINSLEQNSRNLEQKIIANDKYEKDLGVCIKLADEWEMEMVRVQEVEKNLGALNDEYEARLPELQEVEKKTAQAQRRTELLEEQLERAHVGIHKKRQGAKDRYTKAVERHEAVLEAQTEHERGMEQQLNLKAHLASQIENVVEDYSRGLKKGQATYDTIRTEVLHFTMKHQAAMNAIEAKLLLPPEEFNESIVITGCLEISSVLHMSIIIKRLPRFPSKETKHQSDDSSGLLMAIIDRILTARHVFYVCVAFMAWLTDSYNFLIFGIRKSTSTCSGFCVRLLPARLFHGYFIAAGVEMTLVTPLNDWRASCYVGSGLSFFTAGLCAICPDSEIYIQLRQEPQLYPNPDKPSRTKTFLKSLRFAILNHWKRSIYCIILLTAFHSLSHISMDSYQKFLIVNKKMSPGNTGLLVMIGIGGSILGSIAGGWLSQLLGRRITIIMMCTYAGVFVPIWILPTTFIGLGMGVFVLQFTLQAAWGVLPIYVSELSPPGCIATFVGLAYNLGSLFASPVPLLELRAAELTKYTSNEVEIYQYDLTQAVLFGIVVGLIVIITMFGDEQHGSVLQSVGGRMSDSRSITSLSNSLHHHSQSDSLSHRESVR